MARSCSAASAVNACERRARVRRTVVAAVKTGGAVDPTIGAALCGLGYDRDFAVNVSITAALVALLVPPSHNLILFTAAAGGGLSIPYRVGDAVVCTWPASAVLLFPRDDSAEAGGYIAPPTE